MTKSFSQSHTASKWWNEDPSPDDLTQEFNPLPELPGRGLIFSIPVCPEFVGGMAEYGFSSLLGLTGQDLEQGEPWASFFRLQEPQQFTLSAIEMCLFYICATTQSPSPVHNHVVLYCSRSHSLQGDKMMGQDHTGGCGRPVPGL